ncbi:Crp/Fnr family transcriptional regulator [Vibrio penaeicida]|uniref:Cyclic nucleotide-binding protein n=1 Tax=Vibrio penaeicida TaxID=104609 RepID=A0AAV5P191_9VIBR|nr:Crp/Fnr family transcriptional regulator [Vibrio penaeicida]RTZ22849.1 Crp/Fnr family transcriptional regulator [Vibrio penaeicida]GLQ75856.1 cyclic nucleotide-binding protein [Vibrio penaeicida]
MSESSEQRLKHFLARVVPNIQYDTIDLQQFSFTEFQEKQSIFSVGDNVTEVHFLLKGVGRYYYLDLEGVERNKSLVKAGGAFTSISSLVANSPSPFYAETITPCSLASIPYSSLVSLSEKHPYWNAFVRKVYEQLVLKKERREAEFLLLDAKTRYQNFLSEFADESHLIPLRHVAMYLGITNVTLSRIRRELGLT